MMLIDLKLDRYDVYMIRRDADGTTILTIPYETVAKAAAQAIHEREREGVSQGATQ